MPPTVNLYSILKPCAIVLGLSLSLGLASCGKSEDLNERLDIAYGLQIQEDIDSLKSATEKYEEVIALALEAIEGNFDSHKLLGIQFALEKNYNACVQVLQKALAIKPDDEMVYYYLGLCHTHLAKVSFENIERDKNIEMGETAFTRGLEINDESPLLHYGLGVLLGFVKKEVKAGIDKLETARSFDSRDVNVLFALGNLHYQVGNVERSASYYRKIMNILPESSQKWEKAKSNLLQIDIAN